MPTYLAKSDVFLAHESRHIKAGETFETEFPKATNDKGNKVNMRLGSNIELVKAKSESKQDEDEKPDDEEGTEQEESEQE